MIGEPSALRDSMRMNTPRCSTRGIIFSMPIEAMCSCGRLTRQVGVALVGADDDGAGLGDGEIGAGHAGVGLEEIRPRGLPLALRQVVDVAVLRVGADRAAEHLAPRRCAACARRAPRCGSAARRRAAGCARRGRSRSPRCRADSRNGAHLALVGQHRLALTSVVAPCAREDVVARSGCARRRRAPSARARRSRCALRSNSSR